MFLMWNAIQTANLFKISRESVRTYSTIFAAYLSPQANPGKNRTRIYSENDMEVFALIVQMKGEGKLYSDIDAALMNGQRGRLPDEINSIISTEQPELVQLKLAITFLEDELKNERAERQQDKGQIVLLERQLEAAQAKIERLTGENSVLKYRLDENIKTPE